MNMKRSILVLGIALVCLAACEARLSLGETRLRPADDMLMVFVPAGEFEMGSSRELPRYTRELCR